MDRRRLVLQETSQGIQPELTLVIETVGKVENFFRAVQKVNGLEWLGSLDIDFIPPEHGFQDGNNAEKGLRGRLFLVLTDQQALEQLMSLFERWKENPETPFSSGLAPFKQIFRHLYAIRPWDANDRIAETGLLEDWDSRQNLGQEDIPFEAELWFRDDFQRRRKSQGFVGGQIQQLGGRILHQCEIEEIRYHGILGLIPRNNASLVANQNDEIEFFKCEDVMYFRPVGNCSVGFPGGGNVLQAVKKDEIPLHPKRSRPIVGLLDGYPLDKHALLEGRLMVDDPDEYERDYPAAKRKHGTAMASLICHGDWNGQRRTMESPVYVRPIIKPRGFGGGAVERIPEDVLPVDLVHRAVRRMYEAEGGEEPVAPGVRIINLSIGDASRPFSREMSPWARLLDWLSYKYRALFVVSAGNHTQDIELEGISQSDFESLNREDQEQHVIRAITKDNRHRRLLSPAETVNGITVGAAHMDKATATSPSHYLIDPFRDRGLPSSTSAQGAGYRRSIKPDVLFPGGKQVLESQPHGSQTSTRLKVCYYISPPGVLAAYPRIPSNRLAEVVYMRGSSNAAAIATHNASFIHDAIHKLYRSKEINLSDEQCTVLIKTLLVHGAGWGDAKQIYKAALEDSSGSGITKEQIGRFLGYGLADVGKATDCTEWRVTAIGCAKLGDGESHKFVFPLPPSLSSVRVTRRLTITLAWLTPTNARHQNYKVAQLWFESKCRFNDERVYADSRATQRGTVQHEVRVGKSPTELEDGDVLTIKVNCRSDAGDIPQPIDYGLAVTLEVAPELLLPLTLYDEVKERLSVPIHTSVPA